MSWLLAAAVTFATLGPPGLRPHSHLGHDGEHALAFALVGLAFGLAYSGRRWALAAVSIPLIGLLELLQYLAPGRHARLEDFVVDALAAIAGFALATFAEWALARGRPVAGNAPS